MQRLTELQFTFNTKAQLIEAHQELIEADPSDALNIKVWACPKSERELAADQEVLQFGKSSGYLPQGFIASIQPTSFRLRLTLPDDHFLLFDGKLIVLFKRTCIFKRLDYIVYHYPQYSGMFQSTIENYAYIVAYADGDSFRMKEEVPGAQLAYHMRKHRRGIIPNGALTFDELMELAGSHPN